MQATDWAKVSGQLAASISLVAAGQACDVCCSYVFVCCGISKTGMIVTSCGDHLVSITVAANLSLKRWTKDGVKVLMMAIESNLTDGANVADQSSSNRCRQSTSRSIRHCWRVPWKHLVSGSIHCTYPNTLQRSSPFLMTRSLCRLS